MGLLLSFLTFQAVGASEHCGSESLAIRENKVLLPVLVVVPITLFEYNLHEVCSKLCERGTEYLTYSR